MIIMINLKDNIDNIIKKYCVNFQYRQMACKALSVVNINDCYIYSLYFTNEDTGSQLLLTEINEQSSEFSFTDSINISSVCALPALAVITSNLKIKKFNAENIIISGDGLLAAYLNYTLKFLNAKSIVCAGNDKNRLLHLVSTTDINLFYNELTQNEDEILTEKYDLNIITGDEFNNCIKKDIPSYDFSLDSIKIDMTNIIPDIADWISEKKIHDDTFFQSVFKLSDDIVIDDEDLISAILINIP